MHTGLAVFTQQALSGEGAAAWVLGSPGASCLLGRLSAQLLPELHGLRASHLEAVTH